MAKKKTMIYLTEQQKMQLKLQAQEKGESVAAVIREAVDQYLARERPEVDYMAIVGMFETEPDNASERVDEIVGKAVEEDYLRVQEDFLRRQSVGKTRAKRQSKQSKPRKHSSSKKKSA